MDEEPISEPSASYLNARPWHARMTDLVTLPTWRDSLRGLQELAFPRKDYIREQYPDRPSAPLPLLYLDRLGRRAVKMLRPTRH